MEILMKKIYLIPAFGLSLFYAAATSAVTPTINEVAKLIASDGEASDYLGYSVAIDGDTAVVGVYGDDDLGSEAGAAYVFTRDSSGTWNQQQKLTASDGAADDRFGWSVGVDGDTIVVGRESWDFFAPPPGAAYVFTRDSAGVWSEQQKLTAFDGEAGDYFGDAVAVSLDTIVIGADGDDDMGSNTGAAYVYVRDSAGDWNLQQKLTASIATDNDSFGNVVALDGDTAVIGTSGYYLDDSGIAVQSSTAYAFTRDSNGVWSAQELDPGVNVETEWYGRAVAVSGDTIAVGAYGDSQIDVFAGATYLFSRDDAGIWNLQQKITASDGANNDKFGFSLDLDGTSLVVSAYTNDDNGTDSGSAYVFTRDGDGVWNEQLKLLSSDGADYDYLGFSVGISTTSVFTGAYLNDTSTGANAGAAYVFELLSGEEGPAIAVAPGDVDFGEVQVGQSAEQLVTVSNFGTTELTLFDIYIEGGADFSQTNDCPAILMPSEACQVAVTFTPTRDAVLSDTLTVASDDPDQPAVSASLTGTGVTLLPDLTVTDISTPRTITGGRLATLGVTIANQGSADVAGNYWVSLYLDGGLIAAEYVTDAPLAGTETSYSWSVQIPDLNRGTYTLEAVVDQDDSILELDETNNNLGKSVKIN
jgi:hypothetical protein